MKPVGTRLEFALVIGRNSSFKAHKNTFRGTYTLIPCDRIFYPARGRTRTSPQGLRMIIRSNPCGSYTVTPMISNILSTAARFPPAFLHSSPICRARVLNPSDSFPGLMSLAIAVPNSTVSKSGAMFLLPNIPIPRYSARVAISYKSNHWARMIWGIPALSDEFQSQLAFARML